MEIKKYIYLYKKEETLNWYGRLLEVKWSIGWPKYNSPYQMFDIIQANFNQFIDDDRVTNTLISRLMGFLIVAYKSGQWLLLGNEFSCAYISFGIFAFYSLSKFVTYETLFN